MPKWLQGQCHVQSVENAGRCYRVVCRDFDAAAVFRHHSRPAAGAAPSEPRGAACNVRMLTTAERLREFTEAVRDFSFALPLMVGSLLKEYFADQERNPEAMRIASKTLEHYRELAAYVSPETLALPVGEVTLKSGGHHRRTKKGPATFGKDCAQYGRWLVHSTGASNLLAHRQK